MSELVGIPHSKLDCWGLVQLFYLKHGITLPSYDSVRGAEPSDIYGVVEDVMPNYIEVPKDKRQYGDIILINFLGIASHVAIVISKTEMLHSREKYSSVIEKISKWEKRIVAFYRPRPEARFSFD